MTDIKIAFVIIAVLNIIYNLFKWIYTGKETFSAIGGWFCSILWCIT